MLSRTYALTILNNNVMEIFLIDAIGPFFRNYKKRNVNWSKIPFHSFFGKPKKTRRLFHTVRPDFDLFCKKIKQVGYNSVSLDDVAHLAPDPWIEPEVNKTILDLQEEYRKLFAICNTHGLDIYLTMDILSLTPGLKERIGGRRSLANRFLQRQVETILSTFPEIKGIIIRIGECDGKDVKGIFKSELLLRTSRQLNRLLHDLLPIFEHHQAYLILRSWTVGAHQVGDFIWHRGTTAKVLRKIESPWFILSMKYGETDFFRYLPLNKHFFRFKIKKIIELQARREYEGCGEYPSFVGYDYRSYQQQLLSAPNMVGMSVWCQTGGWMPFRRLSYLEPDGIWNEINSFVTLKIFRENMSVSQAVEAMAVEMNCPNPQALLELLNLSDQVVKELLYTPELAKRKLFFRRVRIPSQLSVFWNNIFINHSVRKMMRALVGDGKKCVDLGYQALSKINRMKELTRQAGLNVQDIQYMADTFGLLALAREYYFLPYSDEVKYRVKMAKKNYKRKYPPGARPRYRIKTDFSNFKIHSRHLRWMIRLLLRDKRGYRVLDYLLTLHLLAYAIRFMVFVRPGLLPKFARDSAMGIETILR